MSHSPDNHWSLGRSRRAFLRSAGVGLALPWLPSLPLRAESGKKASGESKAKPPRRFACLYFSNGVEPEHWWAKADAKAQARKTTDR